MLFLSIVPSPVIIYLSEKNEQAKFITLKNRERKYFWLWISQIYVTFFDIKNLPGFFYFWRDSTPFFKSVKGGLRTFIFSEWLYFHNPALLSKNLAILQTVIVFYIWYRLKLQKLCIWASVENIFYFVKKYGLVIREMNFS